MKKITLLLVILMLNSLLVGCNFQPPQCNHSNTTAVTCTQQKKCVDCGGVLVSAYGHNWKEADCYKAKRCIRCSKTEGLPLGHKYENGYCKRCYEKDPTYLDVKTNSILTIEQINHDINSAGGVEVDIRFTNRSKKQIAYVFFTLKFYDRMGGPAYCDIKDTHTQRLKYTGPVNAGVSKTGYWDPIIYNSATAVVKPLSIEIEYTDGTKETINSNGRYWYSSYFYGGELRD